MGRVGFTDRNQTVYINGSERNRGSRLMAGFTQTFLNPVSMREVLTSFLPEGHYLSESEASNAQWAVHFSSAMECGQLILNINGERVHTGDVILNTALLVGNDAVKLMAILDGQCEINAFVRGKNRAWMADIIESDNSGMFRSGKGWDDVVALLRSSDQGTVFLSYSITRSIEEEVFSGWLYTTATAKGLDLDSQETVRTLEEEWQELAKDKKWELCEAWADKHASLGYEISPERWAEPDAYFGSGWNAPMIAEKLEELQRAAYEREDSLA